MNEAPGYVYFVSGGCSAVKIGWSGGDPKRRVTDLQVGNPKKLTLLHVAPGDRKLEKALHRALKFCRLHGEWFESAEPRMIPTVRELLGDPGALDDLLENPISAYERAKTLLREAQDLLSNPDISSADFDKAVQLLDDAGVHEIRSLLLQTANR